MPNDHNRYGRTHRKLRQALASRVATGTVECARCHQPILRGEAWDLGHIDGSPTRYSGPEHRRCNRQTMLHVAERVRRVNLDDYVDDPEAGVYWGPPPAPGAPPRRWSRPWRDWRSEQPTT